MEEQEGEEYDEEEFETGKEQVGIITVSSFVNRNLQEEEAGEDYNLKVKFGENVPIQDDDGYEKISSAEVDKVLPKMRTRFSMSNQEVINLIDPHNQKTFEDNISRINHLLESSQDDYCTIYKKGINPEPNKFRLNNQILTKLVYVHELDLAGNFLQQTVGRRLNDEDMPVLANFLLSEKKVRRLNLSYNNFGDEALLSLTSVLLERTDIVHLNLSHNDFTGSGCQHLLQSLMARDPLYSLKLSGNKIGSEGFKGLVCLILCGRGPLDLDISQTDMGMGDFQSLCTAWEAVEKDEDAPKFLVDHPPPIALEILADMKVTNNEMKRREYALLQRRSIIELIRRNAGDMSTVRGLEKLPEFPKNDFPSPLDLVEKVSAAILEGLFEIPELMMNPKVSPNSCTSEDEVTLSRGQTKINKIVEESEQLPDTMLMVNRYRDIKGAGCVPLDEHGRPVIVCPSLYSLEMDEVIGTETEQRHFIPSELDALVDGAQKTNKKSHTEAPKADSCETASESVMERVFLEAGRFAASAEYQEKSDATQILLYTLLATCQKIKELDNSSNLEFREEELEEIWEVGAQQAAELIYNKIPPGRCALSSEQLVAFVRKFMESSNRTLLRLLQNPFIPPHLFDVGTRGCVQMLEEKAALEGAQKDGPSLVEKYSSVAEDAQAKKNVQKIVMSFLEGAITTAASLIGIGDPFSFRQQPPNLLESALQKSKEEMERMEWGMKGVMEGFILAGATLAVDAQNTNQELDGSIDAAIDPAIEFLEQTFDQVAEIIIETDESRKVVFDDEEAQHNLKFPFASRPTRLVLNRPLFRDFEAIMGGKMGAFLSINTSVKCLHMRNWALGEDGLISMMEGLSLNSNIVLLDLASNGIGAESAKVLAKYIQQNQNLRHLMLNHNCLKNPGLKYMTDAFLSSNVEFLNIAYNDIADSLESFCEILPQTKIRSLYALGNKFTQPCWEWLLPEFCDFVLQEVDGAGMIVKNSQTRDINEWHDVQATVPKGLFRAPYFEESAHIKHQKKQ